MTQVASKQLQPIYDKPMVYYPLCTLMEAGIREIAIISTPIDLPKYEKLFGDGSRYGIELTYIEQAKPEGIAQAFILGKEFIAQDNVCLILGDNIFYGEIGLKEIIQDFKRGAVIFGYRVNDPERYGVIEFDEFGDVVSIEEKPSTPRSNYAVPGLYIYDFSVVEIAEELKPSFRSELEITDVNLQYLNDDLLKAIKMPRGIAWLDTGTPQSMLEATQFVGTIEQRQGLKIACPEEIAYRLGYFSMMQFSNIIDALPKSSYKEYLKNIILTES